MHFRASKKQLCIIITITGIGAIIIAVALTLVLVDDDDSTSDNGKVTYQGAVVANGYECAKIGRTILDQGGNAVDAAIATGLCEGIAMPQSTGLGGGFVMTIYNRTTGRAVAINAREVAPLNATQNMFDNDPEAASTGGKAVAVPGELRGYEMIWKKYGKLEWKEIIKPIIELCKVGNLVTPYLANLFKNRREQLINEPSLNEVFVDPNTGEPWVEGQRVVRAKLAETFELVAEQGADALYNGPLTESFVNDVNGFGGIFQVEDMHNYKPEELEPIVVKLPYNQTLYTVPLPASGLIIAYIMNILKGYLDLSTIDTVTNWQRIVESFKFGYGKRTQMGDPHFVAGIEELIANLTSEDYAFATRSMMFDNMTFNDPEYYGANVTSVNDHGTAHLSVLAPNGDAVSLTGTINLIFGSKRRSTSTGIILNDEMDDFSSNFNNSFGVPPSPANYIVPGKRPLSSMTPCIITDSDGSVRMIIGAAGGTKITTATALLAIKHLWYNVPISTAMPEKRLHHQLFPMEIEFESSFNPDIVQGLIDIGHDHFYADASDGFAAAVGITNHSGQIEGAWDVRRTGSIEYIF